LHSQVLTETGSSCRPQHNPLRLEAKGVLAEAHLRHSTDWLVPCTGDGLLTVSFWFCAGLDSLLGGAGLAVLGSGLGIEAFSLAGALAAWLLPWGALLFSLLPPGSACTASRQESRLLTLHKSAKLSQERRVTLAKCCTYSVLLKSCGHHFHQDPKLISELQMLTTQEVVHT